MRSLFSSSSTRDQPVSASGATDAVHVLLIDDDNDEASLTRSLLARVEDVQYQLDWVPTFGEGLASIARGGHDAYLIDQNLGARSGVELVREARAAGSLAALVMLTGQRDRAIDMAAMGAGATDFLLKRQLDAALLDRTLRYAIEHASLTAAIERSRTQMAALEEIGRVLVAHGPTPAAIGRIVDLIVDRFALDRLAIYVADGEALHLAGQHGYQHLTPSLSRDDTSVERVAYARKPLFVPSLSPDLSVPGADRAVTTELSVPLLVNGELEGLLNIASPVATPLGEREFTAIRMIADRLTVALEIVQERRVTEERLSKALQQILGGQKLSGKQALLDAETSTYRRALLEPLLEVAIACAGAEPDPAQRALSVGLLLLACQGTGHDTVTRLAEKAGIVFASRPRLRYGETELAVLVAAANEAAFRIEAGELLALAQAAEMDVWCGYAALASDWGPAELIAAAEAALVYARRIGPGTVIG